jgi:beta-barrel assembly-enhancing protease
MVRSMQRILLLLVLLITISATVHAMGYEEEREISRELIDILEAQGALAHETDLTWVLQSLTDQLADHIKEPIYNFKIHLVYDRSINAMAITDGNIFINLGTVLLAKDMDEIASVIAHEMGHCQLRHIPEAMKAQAQMTTASIVGVIAGILLSAASPEVGSALVLSSIGGAENMKRQYTRKNELEADEFSRNILKDSKLDASATARFLIRLRTYSDGPDVPVYLLTHPYTQDRIALLEKDPAPPHPDTRYWTLQAAAIGELLPADEVEKRSAGLPQPYSKVAMGISKVRQGKNQEGLALLDGIDVPLARTWKGLALYGLGKKDAAYPLLRDSRQNSRTALALCEIMADKGQIDDAITTLKPFEDGNPRAAYTMGTLYEKKGQPGLAHEAYARYFFSVRNYKSSLYHINKALADKNLDKDLTESLTRMKTMIEKIQKS